MAARKCGMSQPMWSKLERGEVDSEDTSLLPKILEGYKPVRLEWLLRGEGPMLASATADKVVRLKPPNLASSHAPDALRNVEAIPTSRRLIPLLTEVQAGHPNEYIDDFAAGAADEYVEVDAELGKTLGPYSFALVVAGLSMTPEFNPGDKVIVDPNQAVFPGAFVVAKVESANGATLKKYRDRGVDDQGIEQFDLVPLNEDFPTIRINARNPGSIIGVVIEKRKRYR